MKLLLVHARACYEASSFCIEPISGKDKPEEGQTCGLIARRKEYQSRSQEEVVPLPVQALSTSAGAGVLGPKATSPPSRDLLPQKAIRALASFLNIIPLSRYSFVAGC